MSATVPFGYKREKKDPQWDIDEPAAEPERYIFKLAVEGLGPNKIAAGLRGEKFVTPTEYYYSIEKKTPNPRPIDPYSWDQTTVRNILDNRQYTGCAVNGKSSIVSYKVHKTIEYDESETEVQSAKQETVDLKVFLEAIRKCTDITELTPTLVNTLIKTIEVFNSVVDSDGKKHVPITIYFRAAGIITVPVEKEIIAAMEEIRNDPTNVA